jgi:hypothetical protein
LMARTELGDAPETNNVRTNTLSLVFFISIL